MKIVLAAVMFSPNLGDGLIAECLGAAFREADAETEVIWLDLAGRTEFVAPSSGLRTIVLDLLARLPKGISNRLAATLVRSQIRNRLAPNVSTALNGADLMVIGGGQLLADANMNFPLKLAHIVKRAEAYECPIAIHSVGVAQHWSKSGLDAFGHVLTSPMLRFISVRDDRSANNLQQHYSDLGQSPPCPITVVPDPGLCAGRLTHVPDYDVLSQRPNIGLGVVHPAALATHADTGSVMTVAQMSTAYIHLITALTACDAQVHVFTNGSGEDEKMLDTLWRQVGRYPNVQKVDRVGDPKRLVGFLKAMDAVASHRLHACIAANAVGTKAIGFRWDKKIDAYFEGSAQPNLLFDDVHATDQIVKKLLEPWCDTAQTKLQSLIPRVQNGAKQILELIRD
ncbi:MAG: polysaccharide pyruvyl transferase family protein [Paracoccaceae bacterium]